MPKWAITPRLIRKSPGEALALLAIDEYGLDEIDRRLLSFLIEKFNGGPTGLNTLAAAVAEEMDTIETIYEPFLLQSGFLERTPRGRKATHLLTGLAKDTDICCNLILEIRY